MELAKKRIAFLLALVFCLSLWGATVSAAEIGDVEGKLVILHVNDVHSRVDDYLGYASLAARAQEYEAAGADVLVLDAGDSLHGKPVSVAYRGSSLVDILNTAGVMAMAPGNHDFNYGYERLLELENSMEFPVLAANVTYAESGEPVFTPNAVFELGGHKVGVFGLATVETVTKTNPNNVKGLVFGEGEALYETAQEQVDALTAQGCDVIVALGHLGVDGGSEPNRSRDVIANTEGIDLFVDGHSHTVFETGETSGGGELSSSALALSSGTSARQCMTARSSPRRSSASMSPRTRLSPKR